MRIFLTICALVLSCTAHAATNNSKLVVVVANRLLLDDLIDAKLPTISKMLRGGAVGLVSPNCTGPKTEYSVMATANAGSPYRIGSCVREFYNCDETLSDGTKADVAYAIRTGHKPPNGAAVFVAIGQALRDSANLNSAPAKMGALGDELHAAGIETSVFGNADILPDTTNRSAAVLAMDSRGIVDSGHCILYPNSENLGLRQSSAQSPSKNKISAASSKFAVIYFGTSTQLDDMKPNMSDIAYAAHKKEMLAELDLLLQGLVCNADAGNIKLILVSFSPPQGPSWDEISPIVVYPAEKPGVLTSATTRTQGLIAASDFAPTALALIGVIQSRNMIGRPASVVPDSYAIKKLQKMSERVTANQQLLLPVGVGMAIIGALVFTSAALIIAFGLKVSRRVKILIEAAFVTGACVPAALLLAVIAPAGTVGYLAGTALSLAALAIICFALSAIIFKKMTLRATPVIVAYAITCIIILVDAVTGCNLCKFTALSSFQITAMRFYGIGNEYAGLLIGMAAPAVLFATRKPWPVAIVALAILLSLGLGNFGANYGGTAAAVVTFGLMFMAAAKKRFSARHIGIAFVAAVAAVTLFALLDWKLAGVAGSHAARATGFTDKLGGGYLESLAMRKVLFNLKTTFSVKGISVAIAFAPFLALWFWGVQGKVRKLFEQPACAKQKGCCELAGLKAIMVGAAAAYLLNDSGIVFAAIMIAMTVLVLLYSLLEDTKPCLE